MLVIRTAIDIYHYLPAVTEAQAQQAPGTGHSHCKADAGK